MHYGQKLSWTVSIDVLQAMKHRSIDGASTVSVDQHSSICQNGKFDNSLTKKTFVKEHWSKALSTNLRPVGRGFVGHVSVLLFYFNSFIILIRWLFN